MTPSDPELSPEEFTAESRERRTGLVGECLRWLRHNKKWWLLPILIVLLLLGLLVLAGAGGLGPFIYPLA
ncbi:MAG TPA: DUF5989 family protein [Planctomycetota bacterium]|nr:DUF5989 family protein [Planctomycetota bacterium]